MTTPINQGQKLARYSLYRELKSEFETILTQLTGYSPIAGGIEELKSVCSVRGKFPAPSRRV